MLQIRQANEVDFDQIWPIFQAIVQLGDTYAYEANTDKASAFELWMRVPRRTYVALSNNKVVGTYFIKTNQAGPGKHVCNCGYMVAASARGQGIATEMCKHSQNQALELGYSAMQFNFVAASNETAIRLWLSLGFRQVGCLPKAFNHPELGLVDALLMYKQLAK